MRNIDKGYLLNEIVLGKTSQSGLDHLINWIKSTDAYEELVNNIKDVKASTSLYAMMLYEQYYELAIEDINSIEEALIAYAKILYLAQVTRKECFINPLIAEKSIDYSFKMKDIIVFYDNHLISLEDLQKSNNYTLKQKGEAIASLVRKWEEDLSKQIYSVIDEIKEYPRNLPNLKVMNKSRTLELILLIIFDALIIYSLFTPLTSIYEIIHNTYIKTYPFWITSFAMIFIGLWNISFIFEIIVKNKQYHKYNFASSHIFKNSGEVSRNIIKHSEKLKRYLDNCFNKYKPLDASCLDFAFDQKIIEYIHYLYFVNFRGKHPKKDKLIITSKILMALGLFFGSLSTILIVFHIVGRL
jgi:gas vesicle protein